MAQKRLNETLLELLILHFLRLISQSCPTLFNPMDCSPLGSSVHGDSPGKDTGVGCHVLFQGIFPTQGLNPGLPHFWDVFLMTGEAPDMQLRVL